MKDASDPKPKEIKDLKSIPLKERERIVTRIEKMEDDLQGDVKKLTKHSPEYRMRSGNYRVLFGLKKRKSWSTVSYTERKRIYECSSASH
jgi:mRNA interferase RelE/StbE